MTRKLPGRFGRPQVGDIVVLIGGRSEYVVVMVFKDLVQVDRLDGSTKHIAIAFRADQLVIRRRQGAQEGKP